MTSANGVPMRTRRFRGSFTPAPVTVTTRSMSGLPRATASWTAAAVPTFCTTTPTSNGRPPLGTSRFRMALMSCFSAPWGYFTLRGTTSTGAPSARQRSLMSRDRVGLVALDAEVRLRRGRAPSGVTRVPPMTASACSSISRWSVVRYGSHSTPFRMSVSIVLLLRGRELDVGRERGAAETDHARVADAGAQLIDRKARPVGHRGPRAAVGRFALGGLDDHGRHERRHGGVQVREDRRHLPRDGSVHGRGDEAPRLADGLTRANDVPLLHAGPGGDPVCMCNGTMTRRGSGMSSMGFRSVQCLFPGGCTPPLKVRALMILPAVFYSPALERQPSGSMLPLSKNTYIEYLSVTRLAPNG